MSSCHHPISDDKSKYKYNSSLSVQIINERLDLKQPFDERQVRDSECLVYKAKKASRIDRLSFFLIFAKDACEIQQ